MSEPLVVLLGVERATEAGRVLAAAFDDDPLFRHLWPDTGVRRRALVSVLTHQAHIGAELRSAWVALDGDRMAGVAGWIEPGVAKTLAHSLREAWSVWPALLRPASLYTAARVFLELDRLRPAKPHWYLEVLGVDPPTQGLGVGRSLIEVGLRAADAAGVVTQLETAKEENLSWYARFGFEVQHEVRPVDRAPPAWTLARQPVPPAGQPGPGPGDPPPPLT